MRSCSRCSDTSIIRPLAGCVAPVRYPYACIRPGSLDLSSGRSVWWNWMTGFPCPGNRRQQPGGRRSGGKMRAGSWLPVNRRPRPGRHREARPPGPHRHGRGGVGEGGFHQFLQLRNDGGGPGQVQPFELPRGEAPPGGLQQRADELQGDAEFLDDSGIAGDDGVRRDILHHHGLGGDDGAMADGDAGADEGAMADIDVVADHGAFEDGGRRVGREGWLEIMVVVALRESARQVEHRLLQIEDWAGAEPGGGMVAAADLHCLTEGAVAADGDVEIIAADAVGKRAHRDAVLDVHPFDAAGAPPASCSVRCLFRPGGSIRRPRPSAAPAAGG